MGEVCQKCGHIGYREHLIPCINCKHAMEHLYCLDVMPPSNEEVTWSCEDCNQMAKVGAPKLLNSLALPSDRFKDGSSSKQSKKLQSSKITEREKEPRKLRRLALAGEDSSKKGLEFDEVAQNCEGEDALRANQCYIYVYSKPIVDPVWRGSFDIGSRSYGRVAAHLSNKACSKVSEAAKLLQRRLCLEKLPRSKAWPKSFHQSPPTDDNIALFFFPENARDDMWFNELVDEINRYDLTLRAMIDSSELLIFSSLRLPQDYWSFHGKCYLWGVFRKQPPLPSVASREEILLNLAGDEDNKIASDSYKLQRQRVSITTPTGGCGADQVTACSYTFDITPLEQPGDAKNLDDGLSSMFQSQSSCPVTPQNTDNRCGSLTFSLPFTDEQLHSPKFLEISTDHDELEFESPAADYSNGLELFPLQVEDMAIIGKLRENRGPVHLELGLSLPMCDRPLRDEQKGESYWCKPKSLTFSIEKIPQQLTHLPRVSNFCSQ